MRRKAAGEIGWDISVASTIVRTHQHAARARTDPPLAPGGRKRPQGWNTRTRRRGRVPSAAWWRWCWKRGPGPLARRVTSKLHLGADGRCRPLSPTVTPGQRADCTQFQPVLEKIRVLRSGLGRPRK